jgi:segregation and condensation protein A
MSDAHSKAESGNGTPAEVAAEFAESSDQYKVRLPDFEGPLDLLLYLIRKEEVSIYDIPIARITAQYLEYLKAMRELDIAVAGEFLVMAATLIHIKSQTLLPHDPDAPEEELEDPRADLVQQLLEHQKFKGAANALHQRALIEAATFTRGTLETDEENPEVASTVFQLFEVFREVLTRQRALVEIEIEREQVTMAEKIAEIRLAIEAQREVSARGMFERARSKREMVLVFLAILEMVKELIIGLKQAQTFGDIIISKRQERSGEEEGGAQPEVSDQPSEGGERAVTEIEVTEAEITEQEIREVEVTEQEITEEEVSLEGPELAADHDQVAAPAADQAPSTGLHPETVHSGDKHSDA